MLIEGGQDASGSDLNTAEVYDPTRAELYDAGGADDHAARSGHMGVTLPYNGKVLIAGGTSAGAPVTENEVYDPVAGAFVANEPMSVARDEFAANFFALPAVGQVLMSGGVDGSGESARADRDVRVSDHPHRQARLSAGIAGHDLRGRMGAGRDGHAARSRRPTPTIPG